MQFVVFATDKPDSLALRQQVRADHRHYLRAASGPAARVILAGPTLCPHSGEMNGTMLVFAAESREAVEGFLSGDPYAKAGLFERVEIRPWICGLGRIEADQPGSVATRS